MSSMLFLVGAIAFLVVIQWAYMQERAQSGAGDIGLLKMVAPTVEIPKAAARGPGWKRNTGKLVPTKGQPAPTAASWRPRANAKKPKDDPSEPRWKRNF